jgi:dsDNA-binding SOS-regulon protein
LRQAYDALLALADRQDEMAQKCLREIADELADAERLFLAAPERTTTDLTLTAFHELAESLRALIKESRSEERRLLAGSLELIAEIEQDKRRLVDDQSSAFKACAKFLDESLARERRLAILLDQERERRLALELDRERAHAHTERETALAGLRNQFERSSSWRLSSPIRLLGRLLKRIGLNRQR